MYLFSCFLFQNDYFEEQEQLSCREHGKSAKHPRTGNNGSSGELKINEEKITQKPEENKGRVTQEISQEFSRTNDGVLGNFSKKDDFPTNSRVQDISGNVL